MKTLGIIPARMASSRFPGKPLALIHRIPMIAHVYFRTCLSRLSFTSVATCDKDIYDYMFSVGGDSVMTANTHEACTDRTSEALGRIEKEHGLRYDIVIMIQGDEPMVTPTMIDLVLDKLSEKATNQVVNLIGEFRSQEEAEDPNQVKVACSGDECALYMSREPIPSNRKAAKPGPYYRQFGVIGFRRDFLLEYTHMKRTPLEDRESIDMLRIIENRIPLKVVETVEYARTVDTPRDLQEVRELMKNDKLIEMYRDQCLNVPS